MHTKINVLIWAAVTMTPFSAFAQDAHSNDHGSVSKEAIELQRENLSKNTSGKGFGPQSPRDLSTRHGNNNVIFNKAPAHTNLNLCNIHFHENAEHKGGQFTTYAGNGDGKGFQTGFKYSGKLTKAEMTPLKEEVCKSEHGGLQSGDTIEVHYVHSSALVTPGPTLGACLSEAIKNPQLRVEAQVYVLVNDSKARDFGELTKLGKKRDFQQALGIPKNTGKPIQYSGSTTGPSYNEQGSPLQVSWSVRPKVAKVNIESVGKWCEENVFKEDHAHGVRNLVSDPALISNIEK
jgi:hypothetical protein